MAAQRRFTANDDAKEDIKLVRVRNRKHEIIMTSSEWLLSSNDALTISRRQLPYGVRAGSKCECVEYTIQRTITYNTHSNTLLYMHTLSDIRSAFDTDSAVSL